MNQLVIKIQTHEEGLIKKNGLEFDLTKTINHGEFKEVVILEKGMRGGGESLAFHVVDQIGRQYFVQMSGTIFEMLHGAVKGARARFEDLEKERGKYGTDTTGEANPTDN